MKQQGTNLAPSDGLGLGHMHFLPLSYHIIMFPFPCHFLFLFLFKRLILFLKVYSIYVTHHLCMDNMATGIPQIII